MVGVGGFGVHLKFSQIYLRLPKPNQMTTLSFTGWQPNDRYDPWLFPVLNFNNDDTIIYRLENLRHMTLEASSGRSSLDHHLGNNTWLSVTEYISKYILEHISEYSYLGWMSQNIYLNIYCNLSWRIYILTEHTKYILNRRLNSSIYSQQCSLAIGLPFGK